MKTNTIGWISLILIFTTLLWIVLVALSESGAPEIKSIQDKIQSIENQKLLFRVGYLNAAFLTLVTVFFMSAIFAHFKETHSFWYTIAFPFIPIYGLANLISYLSQVFVVPDLISLFKESETQTVSLVLLKLTIHTWPGSAIEALNGFAYAALGIPSIIFPLAWFRNSKILVTGGFLLATSGVFSILSFTGLIMGIGFLTYLSIVSGIIFLLSLIPIAYYFFTKSNF